MKDVNSTNPRFQCKVCAKWMRLFGKDENGHRFQRAFGSYMTIEDGVEKFHEHNGDVCVKCERLIPNVVKYDHPMI